MKLYVELFNPAMGHIDILGGEEFSTINQVIPSVKVGKGREGKGREGSKSH